MKQRTLAMMTGFEQYTRKTRRAIFLEEMEPVVPGGELCALVAPHYHQPGKGRRPVGVERMLRIYFLRQWVDLADAAVATAANVADSAVLPDLLHGEETRVWGRSGVSRTDGSDPGVRAASSGLHPSALPLQGWC